MPSSGSLCINKRKWKDKHTFSSPEIKKEQTVEHKNDGEIIYSWCIWNRLESLG